LHGASPESGSASNDLLAGNSEAWGMATEISIGCSHCGAENRLTVATGNLWEVVNCSRCAKPLGLLSELADQTPAKERRDAGEQERSEKC
jgi:hypothetical protein